MLANVSVVNDFRGLAGLDELIAFVFQKAKTDILNDVALLVRDQTRRRILKEKTAPNGSAWKPAKKDYGHPLLHDTGDLARGIERVRTGSGNTEIRSVEEYAHPLHSGSKRGLVARPIFGVSDANEREIETMIQGWCDRHGG